MSHSLAKFGYAKNNPIKTSDLLMFVLKKIGYCLIAICCRKVKAWKNVRRLLHFDSPGQRRAATICEGYAVQFGRGPEVVPSFYAARRGQHRIAHIGGRSIRPAYSCTMIHSYIQLSDAVDKNLQHRAEVYAVALASM